VALLSQHGISIPTNSTTTDLSGLASGIQKEGNHSFGIVSASAAYSRHDRAGMRLASAMDEEVMDDTPAVSRTAKGSTTEKRSPIESRLSSTQQHHPELPCASETNDQTATETHGVFLGGSVRLSELDPVTVGMEFVLT
jgi:hypothetical protein